MAGAVRGPEAVVLASTGERGATVKRPLRILCLHGPGDAIRSFEYWRDGRDDPDIAHVAFSCQIYDVCRELGAEAWVLTPNERPGRVSDGRITVEHRRSPVAGKGLGYHLRHLRLAWQVWRDVRRFRADVVLLMSPDPYPLLLGPLRRRGVKIALNLHCVLWPKFGRASWLRRRLLAAHARFFRSGCDAILSASQDIDRQVRALAGGTSCPIVDFLPLFRPSTFAGLLAPDVTAPTFRVVFIGRVERNKGVFDLVEIAGRLDPALAARVEFDVCGTGSAVQELEAALRAAGVTSRFRLHGWCNQEQLRRVLGASHLVIVPTTSEFIEGFNMVVVEALLAGRPVVTSAVCPALEYVRSAVLEVPPDDLDAYRRAIQTLAGNRDEYRELQARCAVAASRFLDEGTSFAAALRRVLRAFQDGRSPDPVAIPP